MQFFLLKEHFRLPVLWLLQSYNTHFTTYKQSENFQNTQQLLILRYLQIQENKD